MDPKDLQKQMMDTVQKQLKDKNVDADDILKLASTVKPSDIQDEKKVKILVERVAAMAGIPVTNQMIEHIAKAVHGSGINPEDMGQLMKLMQGK